MIVFLVIVASFSVLLYISYRSHKYKMEHVPGYKEKFEAYKRGREAKRIHRKLTGFFTADRYPGITD